MWIILNDWCGMACGVLTYFIVVFVYLGFIRIGVWDEYLEGQVSVYIHFVIFQTFCFMIFWSHFKCMTTQPGILPPNIEKLRYDRLPAHIKSMI